MSRVTISMKAARWLRDLVELDRRFGHVPVFYDVAKELREAMEPSRKPQKPLGTTYEEVRRRAAIRTKREHRASIREAVVKRAMDAGGLCECGCGEQVRDDRKTPVYPEARGEMDHFWGRGKGRPPESLETCWFLRPACHLAKTRNQPDAATWLRKYIEHCRRFGYFAQRVRAESRLRFVETRSMLGAGVQQRHRDEAEEYTRKLEEKVHKAVFGGAK